MYDESEAHIMIAAICARKSTEQRGVSDEAKSVKRQVTHAKAFALTKGWQTDDRHVFEDDGKPGTEFEQRAGLQSLLAALTPKPPFGVLIVSEQKSIGREMSETSYVIKRLAQAGVEVFEYVHGHSLTPQSPVAKLLSTVQGYADEDHAVMSGERTKEAHTDRVNRGQVVGGRVFGYKHVQTSNGTDVHGTSATRTPNESSTKNRLRWSAESSSCMRQGWSGKPSRRNSILKAHPHRYHLSGVTPRKRNRCGTGRMSRFERFWPVTSIAAS